MGSRIEDRMARQEQFRRHVLSITFGVVVPLLVVLAAGFLFVASFGAR
ncbi:MAG TPA: hypothetical protein VFC99_03685 [Acidimicrobiia bacterium]|nr:hypothetical protein [Acidimicrobiia bacterium]